MNTLIKFIVFTLLLSIPLITQAQKDVLLVRIGSEEKQNPDVAQLLDTLGSIQVLDSVYQLRQHYLNKLDSLDPTNKLNLPTDSLRQAWDIKSRLMQEMRSDTLYQKGDSSYQQLSQWLNMEADQLIKEKLLPEKFTSKLDSLKAFAPDELQATFSEVDKLTKEYNVSLKKYIDADQFSNLVDVDMQQLQSFTNEFQKYTSQLDVLNEFKQNIEIPNIDALEKANLDEYTSKLNDIDELNQVKEVKQQLPTDGLDGLASSEFNKVEEVGDATKVINESAGNEMGGELLGNVEEMKDPAFVKRQALKQQSLLANDVLGEHMETIMNAQEKIEKYKKKYAVVNNAKDVEEGLEKPVRTADMRNRWIYGLNFQFNNSKPISVDFAPVVGYKVHRRLNLGIGGNFRYAFTSESDYRPQPIDQSTFGYNAFSQIKGGKGFFIHVEWENISINDVTGRYWNQSWLAGLGKEFGISKKLAGKFIALYNFNHQQNKPYSSPFIFRFGIYNK